MSGADLVVETIEGYLERAKAGEFRSVHVCAFTLDGDMVRESGGAYSTMDVVAALECTKINLIIANTVEDAKAK